MYIPRHFSETDADRLSALIDDYGFGLLVTVEGGRPFASHIPLLYARDRNLLLGHVARANPQWRHFTPDGDALVIFQGPHGYVSPSWYRVPGVPTWNYAVVHVYGCARALEDRDSLKGIVERLTAKYESGNERPWAPAYDPRMLDAIVGVEIEAREIQGKFKLSQNRPVADRTAVIRRFETSASDEGLALAALMKEQSEPPET